MSFSVLNTARLGVLLAAGALPLLLAGEDEAGAPERAETKFLRNIRAATFDGAKNGENYFSPDGQRLVFQGVREDGNPFYQIYTMDLASGALQRVSPGTGKTTCAYFHPSKNRILFASTHLDGKSGEKQAEEIKRQKEGPARRYSWDFDTEFDIFEADPDGKNAVRLTETTGYDAECAYSPDGTKIVFNSFRDGDGEIYVMDADGKNQKRLTTEKGYDGGPFFSPDGKKIVWRHFNDAEQKVAEVWLMDADGSNKRQVTKLNSVSWAPFFHPTTDWIVFASNHEDPAFEVYAIRQDGSELTRLTDTQGFDGLPVVSPDGSTLMWTSNRFGNKSQVLLADLKMPGEKEWRNKPAFMRVPISAQIDNEHIELRLRQLRGGANAMQMEHVVGKGFMQNKMLPPIANAKLEQVEDTWYVQGPAVVGFTPPRNGSNVAIVLCAQMKRDGKNLESIAALTEAARIAYSWQVAKPEASQPGVLAIAAQEDELPRVGDMAVDLLKLVSPDKTKPITPVVMLSFAGLSDLQTQKVSVSGVGSSLGFKRFLEVLATRHPGVQIQAEEDTSREKEVESAVAKGIPSLAFNPIADNEAGNADPFSVFDGEADGRMADRIRGARMILQCAVDASRMLMQQHWELKFNKFDAAAAKVAAGAARRPYLGTVPEYGVQGIKGVKLKGVREASPAFNAGIKEGDVIVELAGKPLENVEEYLKVLETLRPDDETLIKVQRGTQTLELKIRPGAR